MISMSESELSVSAGAGAGAGTVAPAAVGAVACGWAYLDPSSIPWVTATGASFAVPYACLCPALGPSLAGTGGSSAAWA